MDVMRKYPTSTLISWSSIHPTETGNFKDKSKNSIQAYFDAVSKSDMDGREVGDKVRKNRELGLCPGEDYFEELSACPRSRLSGAELFCVSRQPVLFWFGRKPTSRKVYDGDGRIRLVQTLTIMRRS